MLFKFLRVGATLQPIVRGTGFAVVIEIVQEKHPEGLIRYTLLTDFGSLITLTDAELSKTYTNECYYTNLSEFCTEPTENYQDPHNFSVKERFELQKQQLAEAEVKLREMGLL